MNKLLLTIVIITTLTACQKKPDEHPSVASSEAQTSIATQTESTSQAKEQEAEDAAIAHDRYNPDSIYTGAENIDIPPPQLKRELLESEAVEVKYRPVDAYSNFKVITSTVYDTTRLKVVSQVNDVIDKVEMDNKNCKVVGLEPFTTKFPSVSYYGAVFNIVLKGCSAEEIKEIYLYTTHGKITYRAIVEQ
ncbi:lipoprotein [Acinetobacter guillouiae]|uniref:lipoprotein n=1 Tax=Acinetobacter guillouiae TaxID=106649 RepID=UPI003AF7839A